MTIHQLKSWPQFFQAMLDGSKTFEYRKDDRGFHVGDWLELNEWDPDTNQYSGRKLSVQVTMVVRDCPGLPAGYCIMQTRR